MYGFMHQALKSWLLSMDNGEYLLQEVYEELNLDTAPDDFFRYYSDAQTMKFLELVAKAADTSVDRCMYEAGKVSMGTFTRNGYEPVLRTLGKDFYTMLTNLDSLHDNFLAAFPEMKVPSLRPERLSHDSMSIHYYSQHHGLAPFMMGALECAAKMLYDLDIDIHHRLKRGKDSNHDVFHVFVDPRAFPDDMLSTAESTKKMSTMQLNRDMTSKLFPWHFAVNRSMEIVSLGKHLATRMKADSMGMHAKNLFHIVRPVDVKWEFNDIKARADKPFLVATNAKRMLTPEELAQAQADCHLHGGDDEDGGDNVDGNSSLRKASSESETQDSAVELGGEAREGASDAGGQRRRRQAENGALNESQQHEQHDEQQEQWQRWQDQRHRSADDSALGDQLDHAKRASHPQSRGRSGKRQHRQQHHQHAHLQEHGLRRQPRSAMQLQDSMQSMWDEGHAATSHVGSSLGNAHHHQQQQQHRHHRRHHHRHLDTKQRSNHSLRRSHDAVTREVAELTRAMSGSRLSATACPMGAFAGAVGDRSDASSTSMVGSGRSSVDLLEMKARRLRSTDTIKLHGEIVYDEEQDVLVFVGNPLVQSLEEMEEQAIDLSDMPVHCHGREVLYGSMYQTVSATNSNQIEAKLMELDRSLAEVHSKKEQIDKLLHSILPQSVATPLANGVIPPPKSFDCVTVLFCDIVGFTNISAEIPSLEVMDMLHHLFSKFDQLSDEHGCYKVETIGDAYMVAAGCPEPCEDHALRIARLALALIRAAQTVVSPMDGEPIRLRVGLHSGPLITGVVGTTRPRYCLYGDTVNVASRMESNGIPGCIQATYRFLRCLPEHHGLIVASRGTINVKGKGPMKTFLVLGEQGSLEPPLVPEGDDESNNVSEEVKQAAMLSMLQTRYARRGSSQLVPQQVSAYLQHSSPGCG
ncbi:guanylate cyclase [Salpingoeca rosetta]|uniref:guanylate cyclase n=1 Tax=Salpingoeca rosetta (strain ATCC 50818 / BSB-021) TaxID=946362 RepID=F2UR64_SALR5|nr:guanylate cyclase [Salpingoeca rosetta]EGD80119.1 guanylate cyclase [Salpingoeca rosetta]|eukprot:XP_004988444.1 guanylate cyclase [Salpingoeca rosetta]